MLLLNLCFLPQIYKTLQTKNVEGISLSLWVMAFLGFLAGFIYLFEIGDRILSLTYLLGLLFSSIMLMLIFAYRKKEVNR